MNTHAEYQAAVRSWAAALRAGRSETWSQFRAGFRPPPDLVLPGTGPLPGAAQLDVVRRLAALHAQAPLPMFDRLADRVLASAGPGRGLVDPPLAWPADAPRFGAAAVEPELLPGNELVRAISGVLVPLLLSAPAGPPMRTRRRRPVLGRRRRFTVAGAPLSAAAVAASLRAAGWSEGGPGALHLVLARDAETMMAEHWVARTRAGAERRWRPMWRRAATIDRLPPALRIDDLADRRATAHGSAAVHVVLGADADALESGVRAATGAALRLRLEAPDVVAADLLRRLNPFLMLAGGAEARRTAVTGPWSDALRALAPDRTPLPLGAPRGLLGWAVADSARTATALSAAASAGDYAVHGDPQVLVPDRHRQVARAVEPDDVLTLGIALIAQLWRDQPPEDQAPEGEG